MVRALYILLCFLMVGTVSAQTRQYAVSFVPCYGDNILTAGDTYAAAGIDTVQVTTLRFYISGIELMRQETSVWKEANSYHLLDMEEPSSMHLALNIPNGLAFDAIKLRLGIDSITNVSGAMGGELDPTKGMYWSWQSGYINFKLEGTSPACATRKHEFQFHLGGYAGAQNSMQTVVLKVNDKDGVAISLDIKKFLSGIDLHTTNSIMIPGPNAVALSRKVVGSFSIGP
ncbi:hypothetical protein GCM10023093_06480 [Nemorincola caseinilytica]|uniref:Copper-binding protein MbnP-like domain-containing protein n=1 Tax=Nemorincola caseinilytica TaxID=2054315 RepID=A0ABP8N958_9BACT